MSTVLAAIDNSLACRSVLATARALASVLAADVEALHVPVDGDRTARGAADAAHVTLRTVEGPVIESLIEAGESDAIVAVVIGSRRLPNDRRPLGATALAVATRLSKPVVVVPPHAQPLETIRRVLVPLEGTRSTSVAPRSIIEIAQGKNIEVRGAAHPRSALDSRVHRPATARADRMGTRVPHAILPVGHRRSPFRDAGRSECNDHPRVRRGVRDGPDRARLGTGPRARKSSRRSRGPRTGAHSRDAHTRGVHSVARAVGVNRALGVESGTCRRVPETRRSGITCGRRSLTGLSVPSVPKRDLAGFGPDLA